MRGRASLGLPYQPKLSAFAAGEPLWQSIGDTSATLSAHHSKLLNDFSGHIRHFCMACVRITLQRIEILDVLVNAGITLRYL
jgi:hypothetical protein